MENRFSEPSGRPAFINSTLAILREIVCTLFTGIAFLCIPVFAEFPGGLAQKTTSAEVRPLLTPSELNASLQARGKSTFPLPYNTGAIRLTKSADNRGTDCVNYVGTSCWRNIDNHAG